MAVTGGGFYIVESSVLAVDTLIAHNVAAGSVSSFAGGGGAYAFNGFLLLTRCVIEENKALGPVFEVGFDLLALVAVE